MREFLKVLAEQNMPPTSLMISQGGRPTFARWWWPFRPELPHMLHSATKSFTGTAVGLALAEGRLALDDRVAELLHEHLPGEAPANLRAMTVEDLLTMRTGHASGLSGADSRLLKTSWVGAFLTEPVPERPGRDFTYSSATSHLLSAIVQRAVGEPVAAYLTPRLFEPLGFQDWHWDTDPEGISTGGNGLSVRTQDLLAFGELHLRDGVWDGKRVLPECWVARASAPHVTHAVAGTWDGSRFVRQESSQPREGYGYQLWLGPGPSYYAAGIFGQYCFVLPEHDAVVAITGAMGGWKHRALPELMTRHLLPELERTGRPLLTAAEVAGAYDCEPNEQGISRLEFAFPSGACELRITDGRGTHLVRSGLGEPLEGVTTVTRGRLHHSYQPDSSRVVADARWSGPDALELTWRFVGSAFTDTVVCRFRRGTIALDRSVDVNTGPTVLPTVHGRRTTDH